MSFWYIVVFLLPLTLRAGDTSSSSVFSRFDLVGGTFALSRPQEPQGVIRDIMNTKITVALPGIGYTDERRAQNKYQFGTTMRVGTLTYYLAHYNVLPVLRASLTQGLVAPLPMGTEGKKLLARSFDVLLESSLQGMCYGYRSAASSAIGGTGLLALRTTVPHALVYCGVSQEIAFQSQMLDEYIRIMGIHGVLPRIQPAIEQRLFPALKPHISSHNPEKIAGMLGLKSGEYTVDDRVPSSWESEATVSAIE